MPEETGTVESVQKAPTPSWVVPIIVAWVSSVLTGGLAWIAFQANASYATHATVTGNQAQIESINERLRSIDVQLSNMSGMYVSQNAFLEFKGRYDRDQAEGHDFRVRIDSKMDILLAEHNPKPARMIQKDSLALK